LNKAFFYADFYFLDFSAGAGWKLSADIGNN